MSNSKLVPHRAKWTPLELLPPKKPPGHRTKNLDNFATSASRTTEIRNPGISGSIPQPKYQTNVMVATMVSFHGAKSISSNSRCTRKTFVRGKYRTKLREPLSPAQKLGEPLSSRKLIRDADAKCQMTHVFCFATDVLFFSVGTHFGVGLEGKPMGKPIILAEGGGGN